MAVYTTIDDPGLYFNTKLYNGTGSSNAITGVGFQPDFTWIKRRNVATAHHLHNAISGATKVLNSNTVNAESTDAQKLSSFDSDGFTVGTNGDANNSSGTFASWNWKANGAGSANTDGTISSTVSVNTTSGFSIVSYTGTGSAATVGHGLGSAPSVIFYKNRSESQNWRVVTTAIDGSLDNLFLNTTDAKSDDSITVPSSTVFTIDGSTQTNKSSQNIIAYCFAEKKGFSSMGSYIGNGNADGTFIYTGFKPAFFLGKRTNSTGEWFLLDNRRSNSFNPQDRILEPNSNSADISGASYKYDFVSNGIKIRTTSGAYGNGNGDTFIYMAFAEQPFTTSTGVPATAR